MFDILGNFSFKTAGFCRKERASASKKVDHFEKGRKSSSDSHTERLVMTARLQGRSSESVLKITAEKNS
jgi:hypothetical protein